MGVMDLAGEFESFVRSRTPALLRSAYLLTGDQHLAEDLLQGALTRTHRAWPRVHATGNAEAYTRRAMHHLQISRWRRRRVTEVFTGGRPGSGTGQEDHAEAAALRISLREALGRLTAKQRAVIVLRYFDDLTELETADILGVTVGTVKSQTARALARLRVGLREESVTGGRS